MKPRKQELFEVYVDHGVLQGIIYHCKGYVPLEAIGFLTGSVYTWDRHVYAIVTGHIEGRSKSTRVHVEFEKGAMGEVITQLRKNYTGSIIVGWYHSHPGYGCFLSSVDLTTHSSCFTEPFHVALVVDPVREDVMFYKSNDGSGYREATFATLKKKSSRNTS